MSAAFFVPTSTAKTISVPARKHKFCLRVGFPRGVVMRETLEFPRASAARSQQFHHLVSILRVPHSAGFRPRQQVEQALCILKKKMQREGVFKEMLRAQPSAGAAREKADALRRARKLARKQAIREGLIAAPVRKPIAPGSGPRAPRSNAR
jgi:small subunit ribosomal protein S21